MTERPPVGGPRGKVMHMATEKATCPACGGSGRVVVGPPLGSCDGPQYGECGTCKGSGKVELPPDPTFDAAAAAAVQAAVAGLTYPSETDAPWEVYDAFPVDQRHPEKVARGIARKVAGAETSDQFDHGPAAELFDGGAPFTEEYAGRYRELEAVLARHLLDPQAFRFGRVNITIVVVGRVKGSDAWLALKTTAVET